MIKSFRDEDTRQLFITGRSKKWRSIESQALRKLNLLESATSLEDLRHPGGNRLERLRKDRVGQHSIRINDQYRLCFHGHDGDAWDAEVVDYHS